MKAVQAPKPPRRWSKRRLIFTVSALASAVLVLVVAVVGFARSVDFVLGAGSASETLSEVGQIAPDRTATGGASATTFTAAAATSAPTPAPATTSAPARAVAPIVASADRASSESAATGGANGETDSAAGSGGIGGAGGMAGVGGAGGTGPTPSGFENVVQSMLTLLGQTTSTMCGQNTCNVGQVCCNFSCGTCVAPGTSCDQTQCTGAARAPTAVRCGSGQCNDGQVCCNPSCGICAAPGETCSPQACQ